MRVNEKTEFFKNFDRLKTTVNGAIRVRNNLDLTGNVVEWCKNKVKTSKFSVRREGKNLYVLFQDCEITINANTYTIITAHRK